MWRHTHCLTFFRDPFPESLVVHSNLAYENHLDSVPCQPASSASTSCEILRRCPVVSVNFELNDILGVELAPQGTSFAMTALSRLSVTCSHLPNNISVRLVGCRIPSVRQTLLVLVQELTYTSIPATVDPQLVPLHLRPHLTPAIRKLSLDFTVSSPDPSCVTPASECDRLRAENVSLRACCEVWRKRAAVHAAASLGLVGLARLARDHAMKMRQENCELQQKYTSLKRKSESLE